MNAQAEDRATGPLRLWLAVALVVLVHLAGATMVSRFMAYPSAIDERGHASLVLALAERPTWFPDYPALRMADGHDVASVDGPADALRPVWSWTAEPNYINHPAFYYRAMATLLGPGPSFEAQVQGLRTANIALSTLAAGLTAWALLTLLGTGFAGLCAAVMSLAFPKLAVVGGMINNDNAAQLAAALVLCGVACRRRWLTWGLIALALVLAGWTKLTALVALGSVVLVLVVVRPVGMASPGRLGSVLLGLALALAVVPYGVNLARVGVLVPVSSATFYVEPVARRVLDPLGFLEFFVHWIALKWAPFEPASRWQIAGLWAILAAFAAAVVASLRAGAGSDRTRTAVSMTLAAAAGLAVIFVAHGVFGWRSYVALGDLTTPQLRYYGVLWPFLCACLGAWLVQVTTRATREARAGAVFSAIWVLGLLMPAVPLVAIVLMI